MIFLVARKKVGFSSRNPLAFNVPVRFCYLTHLQPSGLGDYFIYKRFAVQTLLWSLGFMIQSRAWHLYSFTVICKNSSRQLLHWIFQQFYLRDQLMGPQWYLGSKNILRETLRIVEGINSYLSNPSITKKLRSDIFSQHFAASYKYLKDFYNTSHSFFRGIRGQCEKNLGLNFLYLYLNNISGWR